MNKIIQAIKSYVRVFMKIMRDTSGEISFETKKTVEEEKDIHTKKIGKMNFTVESHYKKNAGCDLIEKFRRLIKI